MPVNLSRQSHPLAWSMLKKAGVNSDNVNHEWAEQIYSLVSEKSTDYSAEANPNWIEAIVLEVTPTNPYDLTRLFADISGWDWSEETGEKILDLMAVAVMRAAQAIVLASRASQRKTMEDIWTG